MSAYQKSPKEWLKENPTKTLNDYFKEVGTSAATNTSHKSSSSVPGRSTSSIQTWHILVPLCLLILVFTNPSTEDHRLVVQQEVSEALQKEAGNWGVFNGVRNMGSKWLSNNLVDTGNRTNLLIASTHVVYVNGERAGITLGALGNVWVKLD
jgi:hypothetical protein